MTPEFFHPDFHAAAPWALAFAVAIVACVTDVRSRRIPNWLTLPLISAGFLLHSLIGGWDGVGQAGLGFLIAGVPFLLLWMAGASGGGDAKLMMALGTTLGGGFAFPLLICVLICGAVAAIAWASLRGRLTAAALGATQLAAGMAAVRTRGIPPAAGLTACSGLRMPYAVPILFGLLACGGLYLWHA